MAELPSLEGAFHARSICVWPLAVARRFRGAPGTVCAVLLSVTVTLTVAISPA